MVKKPDLCILFPDCFKKQENIRIVADEIIEAKNEWKKCVLLVVLRRREPFYSAQYNACIIMVRNSFSMPL